MWKLKLLLVWYQDSPRLHCLLGEANSTMHASAIVTYMYIIYGAVGDIELRYMLVCYIYNCCRNDI